MKGKGSDGVFED